MIRRRNEPPRLPAVAAALLILGSQLLLSGCPAYLARSVRSVEAPFGGRGEEIGYFPLDGSVENQTSRDGAVQVSRVHQDVGYLARGEGSVLTLAATPSDRYDWSTFPLVELAVPNGEMPGTIALWMGAIDAETNTDARGSVALRDSPVDAGWTPGGTPVDELQDQELGSGTAARLAFRDFEEPDNTDRRWYFGTRSTGGQGELPAPVDGGWWYMTLTRDFTGSWTLYLNGERLRGLEDFSTPRTFEEGLHLVLYTTTYIETETGERVASTSFDRLRLYDGALSAAEVRELYAREREEVRQ